MEQTTTGKPGIFAVLAVMGLVTGNLIGAGILALPINLGLSGMLPSLLAMVVYGSMMFFSAVVLSHEATEKKDVNFDYPSLYEKFLGSFGKWVATATNMLILYGLLTAYITGGTKILANILHITSGQEVLLLVFAALLITLAALDLSIIQKYNIALMLVMAGMFVIIVCMGEEHADTTRLSYSDWIFLPAAIPLIVTAFHFHNIIPTLCGDLKWNKSAIWKAMLGGMIIAFIMNLIWVQVGISALPLSGEESILDAYENSLPATVPMSNIISSKTFIICATGFSMLAVVTSFLANGIGLQSFIRDLLYNSFKVRARIFTLLVTFIPPTLISVLWPDIFLKAIGVVGGIGIVTLFGILPCLVAIIRKNNPGWMRGLGVVFLLLSLGALGVEICQETGITNLKPGIEVKYWKHSQHKMPLQIKEKK